MFSPILLVVRIILLVYVACLLTRCGFHIVFQRAKKYDRRNVLMYSMVVLSLVLTAAHIAVNIWGGFVSGNSVASCKVWRLITVILYPLCLTPVTVLLWFRQKFFYELNIFKRSTPRWLTKLSTYLIYPILGLFLAVIIFFVILYTKMGVMHYKVENGTCISGKSKGFSSVFRAIGILIIIGLHCLLLYLFIRPLRMNIISQENQSGKILEVRSMSSITRTGSQSQSVRFRSITDIDRALIKKMIIVTAVVIATDILSILLYALLKKLDTDLNLQSLALDIQVLVTSISNVVCWKNWKDILFPCCGAVGNPPEPGRRHTFSGGRPDRAGVSSTTSGSYELNKVNKSRNFSTVLMKRGHELP